MTPDEMTALLKRATPRKHYPIAPPGTYVQYVGPHPPDAAVDTLRNVAPLLIDLWRADRDYDAHDDEDGTTCAYGGKRGGVGNHCDGDCDAALAIWKRRDSAMRALAEHTEEGTP